MSLNNSSSAKVGVNNVTAIASATAAFRQILCYVATTISSAITGTTGLVKNGAAQLTLSGNCDYTGPTSINQGSLLITGQSILSGVISGAGSLAKSGSLPITISGNNTYTGGTNYSSSAAAATITFSSGNVFGTGDVTCSGPCQVITAASVTVPNNFILNSGATMQYRTAGAQTYTISGSISGAGNVSKTGNGIVVLSGALTYTGVTTITAGSLRAFRTTGASTATATFGTTATLSVSFDVPPAAGTQTFRFFQGSTSRTYTAVALTNAAGRTGSYNSTNSTLTII
jgi:fibronectin-binding autotransporter adhesin